MSQPFRTQWTIEVAEGVTVRLTGRIVDAAGAGISASALDTLRLTLYEQRTGAILNGRDQADILNTGGGTVSSAGDLVLVLSPADTALVHQSAAVETHVAYLEWTYNSGADRGRAVIEYPVRNLRKAT